MLRSGPEVPLRLPRGLSLYPGAKVLSNTVVERGDTHKTLLVFETSDPQERVIEFYRAQARAAGLTLALDLGAGKRASLGGQLPGGGTFAITTRQAAAGTRVELSTN